MTAAQITAIPLFGRNTFYTAIATPSVIQSGDPQFVRYQDQSGASLLSLGGGPRRGNAYLIEGVSITDFVNRASWVPSTEAVEDMRVQLKTYDAEMGRAAGGVFNVTAKSGSNAWHGSALFINKPGWGTGQLFFAKRAGIAESAAVLLLVGRIDRRPDQVGPDVLLVQQGRLHAAEHAQQRADVPDGARAHGRLLAVFNRRPVIVIYDPLTTRPNPIGTGFIRDPFPGNVIPLDRLNPIALRHARRRCRCRPPAARSTARRRSTTARRTRRR